MRSTPRKWNNSAVGTAKWRKTWPSFHPSNQLMFVRVWSARILCHYSNTCVYYGHGRLLCMCKMELKQALLDVLSGWHKKILLLQHFPNHKYESLINNVAFPQAIKLTRVCLIAHGIFTAPKRSGTCHFLNKQSFDCSLAVKFSTFLVFQWMPAWRVLVINLHRPQAERNLVFGTEARYSEHSKQDH